MSVLIPKWGMRPDCAPLGIESRKRGSYVQRMMRGFLRLTQGVPLSQALLASGAATAA